MYLKVVFFAVFVSFFYFDAREYPVHTSGGILVTGGSSGIGKHAALALDALGYTVYPTVRKESDVAALVELRPTLRPVLLDVRDEQRCNQVAAEIEKALENEGKPFVGLVNNAGISRRLPMELENMKSIKNLYDVNIFGVLHTTKAFLPLLRAAGGGARIVNIGSTAAIVPHYGSVAYSAAKSALEAMTDVMRQELMQWDISVSIVEPAYVKTKIASKQTGKNSAILGVPPEKLRLYQAWADSVDANRLKNEAKAADVSVTNEAIVVAINNRYPQTRYVVANVGNLPAKLVAWLQWLLPDRLMDRIVMSKV